MIKYVLILLTSMISGCYSPSIDNFADRANQGLHNSDVNVDVWFNLALKGLKAQETNLNTAFKSELIEHITTQPDSDWIDEHIAGYVYGIGLINERRQVLYQARSDTLENNAQTQDAINRIKELNKYRFTGTMQ